MDDLKSFLESFQDFLAPKLDTYEQAIYLYIFRHSRLVGRDEVVIGFKSARTRLACGVGEGGHPMSENTAARKLEGLRMKGCVEIIASERTGRRIRLRLPEEISGVIPARDADKPSIGLEEMDFFSVPENRLLILARDDNRCFYCLRTLTSENYVIEHVISRPVGDNSYRNVVAACRACNNRKNDSEVADFLRSLYRDGLLSSAEFDLRVQKLNQLQDGELKPLVSA